MLPAVPPLMPKVSVPLLELWAMKVPLVAVKLSNVTVSISIGPVTAVSVGGSGGGGGGCMIVISGTGPGNAGSGGSEFCSAGTSV